jgi:large subunit ribosomal protein L9
MEVILLEDIPQVGKTGDVISVSNGFGRNFLIPQKKAALADRRNIKQFEHQKKLAESKRLAEMATAQAMVDKIESISVKIFRKVGEQEKLYGSVSSQDVAEVLAEKGVEIDRRKIVIEHPIKMLGDFDISVRLFPEISATLKLSVVAEEQE